MSHIECFLYIDVVCHWFYSATAGGRICQDESMNLSPLLIAHVLFVFGDLKISDNLFRSMSFGETEIWFWCFPH